MLKFVRLLIFSSLVAAAFGLLAGYYAAMIDSKMKHSTSTSAKEISLLQYTMAIGIPGLGIVGKIHDTFMPTDR
jgi:NhaP-type Na+/H+ or K+/H+ antiporter